MSATIHVVTNNSCPNSKAFNCPLLATRARFNAKGFALKFLYTSKPKASKADFLFVNSNVFRPYWRGDRQSIIDFLDDARDKGAKILWFDTTDSAWATQFPVLSHVDLFLKSQIYADLDRYQVKYPSGRIFTDFFSRFHQIEEKPFDYELPDRHALQDKLRISWNTCYENYTESRFSLISRLKQRLRPYCVASERFNVAFSPPEARRKTHVSCRVGTTYSRPSVTAHREAVIRALSAKYGIDCGKIPLPEYFEELRDALVGIGPFGVGEITLRDFEIIICGAALVKPDMSHARTWPDLFRPDETFVAHRWDLADLIDRVDSLLNDQAKRVRIAKTAQDEYKKALSPQGLDEFTNRLLGFMNEA